MRSAERLHGVLLAVTLLLAVALTSVLPTRAVALSSANNTPFPASRVIRGAVWISARHGPPSNQWGDVLSTPWDDDGNLYVLMDDGGINAPRGALWRNSFGRINGWPPRLKFSPVGVSPPPATWAQIRGNPRLWTGPLGSYYSMGFAIVDRVFYATQMNDWSWNANGPFNGLAGIAYSTDEAQHWQFPAKPFAAPIGNLDWVKWGSRATAPDGYVYAIATDREFNASFLLLGRSRATIADITDPSHWQWASGWIPKGGSHWPVWSSSIPLAQSIVSWRQHIAYPRMVYDPGIHRYLLTFTYSYGASPPAIWQDGSELVILEGPHPWGPFSFVARGKYFGPSNGYDPSLPPKWISRNGQDLWMIYAANFHGCARGLSCAAGYGFNYQRLHLVLAPQRGRKATTAGVRGRGRSFDRSRRPGSWRRAVERHSGSASQTV